MSGVMDDDARDREEERCKLFGLPANTDTSSIAAQIRPIMPHSLRTLQVDAEHFSSENFEEEKINQLLALMTIISNSSRAITNDHLWRVERECDPSHKKFTPPRGLQRIM